MGHQHLFGGKLEFMYAPFNPFKILNVVHVAKLNLRVEIYLIEIKNKATVLS